MADAGHDMTDALLKETERKVKREYERAYRETQRKLKAYWKDIEGQAAKQRELLNAGKISQKDYDDWMLRHAAMGKRWEDMRDNLAQDYYNYNQIARSIVKGYQPEVYALNHNYATYQVEHSGGIDTAYTLYDKQTVERLIREDQVLMPDPSPRKKAQIARNKAMQWNKQALQSALTQGILQGESIPEIADRIARTVSVRNYNDSVRYARTMFTSAENAGRYDGYRRADKMGIDLTIEWCATLDHRTRHDHRMMHGQRTTVDEPFMTPDGYTIYYPADCTGESNAPQKEIWNCRCTLLAWVKGFERDTVKSSPKMGEMSFEEWQNEHAPKGKDDLVLTLGRQYSMSDLTIREEKSYNFSDGTSGGVRKTGKATIYTTPDGIEFVYPKGYNKKHQTLTPEQLLAAYNRVPEEIRSRGQTQIIVQDVYNPMDSYWRKTYKGFTHSYMIGGKDINIWRHDYAHDDAYLTEALAHEMAHWIDWQGTYPVGPRFSGGSEWADAMAKDLALSGVKSPTKYGANAPVEDFAESFAQLTNDIIGFKERFPNRYKIIAEMLKK